MSTGFFSKIFASGFCYGPFCANFHTVQIFFFNHFLPPVWYKKVATHSRVSVNLIGIWYSLNNFLQLSPILVMLSAKESYIFSRKYCISSGVSRIKKITHNQVVYLLLSFTTRRTSVPHHHFMIQFWVLDWITIFLGPTIWPPNPTSPSTTSLPSSKGHNRRTSTSNRTGR